MPAAFRLCFPHAHVPYLRMKARPDDANAMAFVAALGALLTAAWFAYRPGIDGAFLLDDSSNLSVLGTHGPVTHWAAFWRYVTSGSADPTGRPLTLLSFLIDAQDWPAPAAPFKYTNILLHLLNGVLLCWAMLKIARRRGLNERRTTMAALIGSGIWLLHPLLVSTTLYVIQREAMLPATFTFIGFICWCSGRDALDVGKFGRAILWLTAGAWLCTLLATLAKANGILLPLLLAVAEATVLHDGSDNAQSRRPVRRAVNVILLGVPIALLATYLIRAWPGMQQGAAAIRPWSAGQRLLSEPRVLTDYLRMLWIPQTTYFGLFHDQVAASTSLLRPWTTLPCIVFIVGLITSGWLVRRRFPWLAFAILFYFAGQLLESSFIPLELAFEHRNYLPAAFMFMPLGLWLSTPRMQPLPWRFATIALLCLLAGMTWARAGVWGNLLLQGRIWGRINPDSPQAQTFSSQVEAASGRLPEAIEQLRAAATRMPDQPQTALTLVNLECLTGSVSPSSWRLAISALRHTRTGWNNIANWMITHIPTATSHQCRGLTSPDLQQAFATIQSNPVWARSHRHDPAFERVDAMLHLVNGQPQQALTEFEEVLATSPNASTAFEQANVLDNAGHPELALELLNRYAALPDPVRPSMGMAYFHAWILSRQGHWQSRLDALRRSLERQMGLKTQPHTISGQSVPATSQPASGIPRRNTSSNRLSTHQPT